MNQVFGLKLKNYRALLLTSLLFGITSTAWATSRVGKLEIREQDGLPCFAISHHSENKETIIRLYSLNVSAINRQRDWKSQPIFLWDFSVEPKGSSIEISTQICIKYGEVPLTAKASKVAQMLETKQLYTVHFGARPTNGTTATLGYDGTFCIRETKDSSIVVQVPWDAHEQRWHDELCDRQ